MTKQQKSMVIKTSSYLLFELHLYSFSFLLFVVKKFLDLPIDPAI